MNKLNRYICDKEAKNNVHYFRGAYFGFSAPIMRGVESLKKQGIYYDDPKTTIAQAMEIAKELYRDVKPGEKKILSLNY